MPEKAFKMQGWVIAGNFVESHFEQATISKWLVAGAAAGVATTIIGEIYITLDLNSFENNHIIILFCELYRLSI